MRRRFLTVTLGYLQTTWQRRTDVDEARRERYASMVARGMCQKRPSMCQKRPSMVARGMPVW
jgi:hypothetical protein